MSELPINLADAAVILVIVLSGIFALVRGLIHELLAVGSWGGAAIATVYAFPRVQPFSRNIITIPLAADIVAGVVIFLAVLVALSIITHMIARRVRRSHLGALDRSLGLLFGLFRGAVLICVAWLTLTWTVPRVDYPAWLLEARSLPLVERGALLLVDLLPPGLRPSGGFPGMAPAPTSGDSIYNQLISPTPKGAGPEEFSGYKVEDRKGIHQIYEAEQ